jgi:hypothetical protein
MGQDRPRQATPDLLGTAPVGETSPVRTGSLRTQSARHRVDHGTICGRSCANSGHCKPLCACVDRTKFVAAGVRGRAVFSSHDHYTMPPSHQCVSSAFGRFGKNWRGWVGPTAATFNSTSAGPPTRGPTAPRKAFSGLGEASNDSPVKDAAHLCRGRCAEQPRRREPPGPQAVSDMPGQIRKPPA